MWPGGSGAARTERTGEKKDFSECASEFRCLSGVDGEGFPAEDSC